MNYQLFQAINDLAMRNDWLDNLMIFSAKYLIFVITLAFVIVLGVAVYHKEWRKAVLLVATLAVSFIILKMVSSLIIESRPFIEHQVRMLIEHKIDNSFPSDHATATFAMAISLFYFTKYRALAVGMLLLALLVGFARVFAGVHFPGDILAGWLIALAGGTIIYWISRIWPHNETTEP